jgi:hypothetical protein
VPMLDYFPISYFRQIVFSTDRISKEKKENKFRKYAEKLFFCIFICAFECYVSSVDKTQLRNKKNDI